MYLNNKELNNTQKQVKAKKQLAAQTRPVSPIFILHG